MTDYYQIEKRLRKPGAKWAPISNERAAEELKWTTKSGDLCIGAYYNYRLTKKCPK